MNSFLDSEIWKVDRRPCVGVAAMLVLMFTALGGLDKTVTMYHVNPQRFGPVPRDMDAADVPGDLFFELFESLSIPLACNDPTVPKWKKPFECNNLETNDPTTVVNKLHIRVDSNFSQYAMCNIGNKEGKDPLGRPCPVGGYCCYCNDDHHHGWPPRSVPCNATVGYANLYEQFAKRHESRPCDKDYECWTSHAASKLSAATPGAWYSPQSIGDCDLHTAPANCTWKTLSVEKIVNSTCHSDSFFGAVQRASPPEYFANCTGGGTAKPNATDPCWIRGFYTGVLGPDAAKSRGWKIGGIPLADLISYWEAPFASDDPAKGGCPALPIPPRDAWLRKDAGGMVEDEEPSIMTVRQRRKRDFLRWWYGQQQLAGQ